MAFMLTGLSRESARFQSHSDFTGVGFTTQESESIVEHPVRRHLAMALMMLGNIGIATVIATLTVTLPSERTSENRGLSVALLISGVVVLWVLAKSRWVEQQLNRPIAFALKRFSRLDVRDYVSLLELANGFAVTELQVEPDDWVANKTLVELEMAREGVLVLGIRHKNADYLGAPSGDSRISALDTVVIYGPLYRINELDTRCAGIEGNQAHAHACHEYDSYLEQVATEESAEPPEA